MTALEAIVTVLTESGEPLDCRTITQRILDRHLWSTTARVPEQSIHPGCGGTHPHAVR